MTRELSNDAVVHEALAFRDFVERGGSAGRWLASKDLTPADRQAILRAAAELEREDGAA